jgi:hypothetical protein
MATRDSDLEDLYDEVEGVRRESPRWYQGRHTGLIVVLFVSGAVLLGVLVCGGMFKQAVFG